MKTLDRYMAKKFLTAILAVFLLCFVLIFLIDLIEMLRESLKKGCTLLDAMMISLLRVPSFAELALPFAILIGCIGAFLGLSKNSELIVARSCGMSVWQFIRPAIIVGVLFGLFSTALYNPVASLSRSYSEDLQTALSTRFKKKLITTSKPIWLRQDGPDGQSILTANHASKLGTDLSEVIIFQYDKENQFKERIDAKHAFLEDGRWSLSDVKVSAPDEEQRQFKNYFVATYLTRTQVQDTLGNAETIPFWALPHQIEIAEKAGLPAKQYRMQYQMLLSRPLWMVAMVLLAATCSLQAFRFGNIQKMILYGLLAGFAFFVFAQISQNMGLSGHTAPFLAAWGPAIVACLVASTVLIHQEDG